MNETQNKTKALYLRIMLRPIVRFCLRHTMTIQEVNTELKTVFVEACAETMQKEEGKVNVSRIHMRTGVNRRDASTILKSGSPTYGTSSVLNRVIAHWENSANYQTSTGKPRALPLESKGTSPSFSKLVREVSRELNARSILSELERAGYVERQRGKYLLQSICFVDDDIGNGLETLALDTDDLMGAVEENCYEAPQVPNLHCRTEYDNIAKDSVPEIRRWLLNEGSKFHKRVRSYLSNFDKDINPELPGESGARIVIGSFSKGDW